jgi:hypothetical protein
MTEACLFASNDREEHVESNLHSIDKDEAVLGGDELEVDGMNNRPYFPRSLAGCEEITLDLVDNDSDRIAVHQSQVREEDSHENRAPDELINTNLQCNMMGFLSFNLLIKPVVEKVTRGAVVNETKDTESDESLHVEWSTADKNLTRRKRRVSRST